MSHCARDNGSETLDTIQKHPAQAKDGCVLFLMAVVLNIITKLNLKSLALVATLCITSDVQEQTTTPKRGGLVAHDVDWELHFQS
jgi:hypothetical protein